VRWRRVKEVERQKEKGVRDLVIRRSEIGVTAQRRKCKEEKKS